MKTKILLAGFALFMVCMIAPLVSAQEPFQWEGTIEPKDISGFPLLPISETESMDVTIDSSEPLTVFIIDTQEDYQNLIMLTEEDIENFTGYEQKFEDVTYKEITQDYDADNYYWVMMYNPSETEVADVTVEYEYIEDITGEIVEDAASDVCCGSTLAAGAIGIIVLIAIVLIVRKRK